LTEGIQPYRFCSSEIADHCLFRSPRKTLQRLLSLLRRGL